MTLSSLLLEALIASLDAYGRRLVLARVVPPIFGHTPQDVLDASTHDVSIGGITKVFQERYFEDYALGEQRQTIGRTITETDIVLHAGQTGDFYPHHMDAEWCKTQDFGQRIAHGTLIFSVAVGMTAGAINPLAFSYGYDRLRFIKPVFIGDTIHVQVTIADKRDHPKRTDHGVVVEKCEVFNQRQELVLVCEHLLLAQRRTL